MIIGDGNGQKNNTLFLVDCKMVESRDRSLDSDGLFSLPFSYRFFFFLIIIILGSLNANIFIFLIDVLFFKLKYFDF